MKRTAIAFAVFAAIAIAASAAALWLGQHLPAVPWIEGV